MKSKIVLAVTLSALLCAAGSIWILNTRSNKHRQIAEQIVQRSYAMLNEALMAQGQSSGISIEGDMDFKLQVARALFVMENNSPADYSTLTNNIGTIVMGTHTGWPHGHPLVSMINKSAISNSATWCAAILIRQAQHAALYNGFQKSYPGSPVPKSAWWSWSQQKKVAEHTLDVFKRIGAPQREIEHLQNQFARLYPKNQQDVEPAIATENW